MNPLVAPELQHLDCDHLELDPMLFHLRRQLRRFKSTIKRAHEWNGFDYRDEGRTERSNRVSAYKIAGIHREGAGGGRFLEIVPGNG